MATRPQLTSAVQGARHETITVTWGIDLTATPAPTITGTKRNIATGVVTALDGSFAISTPATAGIFVWTLGAGDVGAAGIFEVQFKATFTNYAMTIEAYWRVYENQGAGVVPAGALVGVTAEQAAFLDDVVITNPTDGQVLTYDLATDTWANEDAAGGLSNVVEDTTPQLGGDLDLNGNVITGMVIGTDIQAYDAQLADIAGLAVTDGNIIVGDGANWTAESGATARTSLGAAAAADLTSHTSNTSNPHSVTAAQVGAQAADAELTAIAGLTSAANKGIQFTGAGTAATYDLSAFALTILDDANGAAVRATIAAASAATLTSHLSDTANPHAVTAAQAGALPTAGGTMSGTLAMADNLITRPKFTDYGETLNAIGSIGGGTQDIDLTLGNVVSGTVDTSTTTFTFSNPPATGTAGSFTLFLTNGGSQTVNWPASVQWAGGTAPTLTAAGVDVLTFTTLDGGTTWYGFAAGLSMAAP